MHLIQVGIGRNYATYYRAPNDDVFLIVIEEHSDDGTLVWNVYDPCSGGVFGGLPVKTHVCRTPDMGEAAARMALEEVYGP